MRWILLIVLILSVLGLLTAAVGEELDAAFDLQGHRIFNAAVGMACIVVFFVLAVGIGILLTR
ncbi:MAG: hypothetical protein KJZ87_27150 [Thermoguttaceae bacterium]|nr:hypothetical protein [Thermoguttaceae bacterium]